MALKPLIAGMSQSSAAVNLATPGPIGGTTPGVITGTIITATTKFVVPVGSQVAPAVTIPGSTMTWWNFVDADFAKIIFGSVAGGPALTLTESTGFPGTFTTVFNTVSATFNGALNAFGATLLGGGFTAGFSGTAVTKLRHGTATLSLGVVTVTDTEITANSHIFLSRFTAGGTVASNYAPTRSAGASFTITANDAGVTQTLDTSVVAYLIIEP